MAKGGTIEIDVELQGAQDIKEGLGSIGTAGKALAANMGVANEKLGEGLENVGESVFGVVDSFAELKTGIGNMSGAGIKGFTALLGPIGMVVTAGFTLYETFKLISGAAQEAEENTSAMSAAASDLQSKLEALSEKGVLPLGKELEELSLGIMRSQFAKEKLQLQEEKLTQAFRKQHEAQLEVKRVEAENAKVTQKSYGQILELTKAREAERKATEEVRKQYKKLEPIQKKVSKDLAEQAKRYKEIEETSAEFLKAKILENAEILKALQLKEAENNLTNEALEKRKIEIENINQLAKIKAKANEEDQKKLALQHKAIEDEIKGIDQVALANEDAERKKANLILKAFEREQAERAKRRENELKAQREREAQAQRDQAAAMRLFAEQTRIKQLELEAEEDSTQKQINLATHRYVTQLQLAKDNQNLQKIAILEFNASLKAIRDKEAQEVLKAEQERFKQAQAFSYDTAIFNAQQIENSFERENELLRLKYEKQIELARDNQLQVTELTRRYGVERNNLVANEAAKSAQKIEDFFGNLGKGMAQVAVNSILMGKSFKEATGQLLMSLAQQAGVEALMETARGVATALNPITAPLSAAHFKAAGIFTAAAVAAGTAGAALGGGGGASVGGGGGAMSSPMGSPQTSSAPEREDATNSSMVFNINFSGAVVYDTRKAAEMALADRVTRAMNTQRRGAPRRRS